MDFSPTEEQLAVQTTAREFAQNEVLPKAAELIRGRENWITNGPVGDGCVLFTMNDKVAGHKGVVAFILPMKTKGVGCGEADDKLGIPGTQSSQVFLADVRLPGDARLGEV